MLLSFIPSARILIAQPRSARRLLLSAMLVMLCHQHAWAQLKEPAINQDESKVPAYQLPDPLRMANGTAISDASSWRTQRRPEIHLERHGAVERGCGEIFEEPVEIEHTLSGRQV